MTDEPLFMGRLLAVDVWEEVDRIDLSRHQAMMEQTHVGSADTLGYDLSDPDDAEAYHAYLAVTGEEQRAALWYADLDERIVRRSSSPRRFVRRPHVTRARRAPRRAARLRTARVAPGDPSSPPPSRHDVEAAHAAGGAL